jgi:ribonuclease HI
MVEIFTDGACAGNPGKGGYGVILSFRGHEKEISEGFKLTTNNRMELLAVIVGLEALKADNLDVTIYSDSQYVVNSVEKGWIWGWLKKGFAGKANEDLWRRYIPLHQKQKVKFKWIKGHAGHPQNERCDRLAVAASQMPNLPDDKGYKKD